MSPVSEAVATASAGPAAAPCPPLGGDGARIALGVSFAVVVVVGLLGLRARAGGRALAPAALAAAAHPALWLHGAERCGERPLLSAALLCVISVAAALSWSLRKPSPPADRGTTG